MSYNIQSFFIDSAPANTYDCTFIKYGDSDVIATGGIGSRPVSLMS